jgi:hypothetical protein
VRDVLSNTYHDRWIGRGGPTARPTRPPDLNPLRFYLWGHLNISCVSSSCWQWRRTSSHCGCVSDYTQLPRYLWTDVVVHEETCRGVRWISMEDILSIYYTCIPSTTITNCLWAHTDMDISLYFVMWNSCPKFVRTFQLHPVHYKHEV